MVPTLRLAVFFLGLATLIAHEMDAMVHGEWRLLPLLQSLSDPTAREVFLLLHVPLFALVLAYVASEKERIRQLSRLVLSAFLVIHAGLHVWFSGNPRYDFDSETSRLLIFGGAALGAIYLALSAPAFRRIGNR